MQNYIELILIICISSIVLLISILIFSAILRRLLNKKKYETLDKQRDYYRKKLEDLLNTDSIDEAVSDLSLKAKSLAWQALEEIMLDFIKRDSYRAKVKELFKKLGYVDFYEEKLKSRNAITRSSAIDKLGKMLSDQSTDKLIKMLKVNNTEILSVTFRSLSRIKSREGLIAILDRLPDLFQKRLISLKIAEITFLYFGLNFVPIFVEHGKKCQNPTILAIILDILSNFKTKEILALAAEMTTHENADVRAKAAKAIGAIAEEFPDFDRNQLLPLLHDEVYFVKLQAIKCLGNLKYHEAADLLGELLLDDRWQIRNVAALALTNIGDNAVDVMLRTLRTTDDTYAKERICEEIGKTDLVNILIGHLNDPGQDRYQQSKEILQIMHILNFVTPLNEYLLHGTNDQIKEEIKAIIEPVPKAKPGKHVR